MKKNNLSSQNIKLAIVFALSLLFAASCKKSNPEPEPEPVAEGTRTELTTDSIFLYAKEVYLWYKDLPSYEAFNPRQYADESDEEAGFDRELFAITRYAINPLTNLPYEYYKSSPTAPEEIKYSYIHNSDDNNPVAYVIPAKSSVDLEGNGYDFGFQVNLYGTTQSYSVIVEAVFKGSPAEKAGIKRGDIFTVVNNRQVTTDYNETTLAFLNNAFFDASTISLTVRKSNGTTINKTLQRASYKSNPVYRDSVYTNGTKKIGYLAYARFSTMDNSKSALDACFARFAKEGVTDLIIDFRYNGGGYVTTAEYLANLIAPNSINNQIMYKEYYNDLMRDKKAPLLKNQVFEGSDGKTYTYADVDFTVEGNTKRFAKKGSLNNISKVVFIVSESTASASELVINSLKPYMNVQLVGEKTYGKPIGFFPITIDKYEVYFSMFESKNKNDEGGYYEGIAVNHTANDDVLSDFGDLGESSLSAAYNYLVTGSFTTSTARTMSAPRSKSIQVKQLNRFKPAREEFKGLIKDNIKVKP